MNYKCYEEVRKKHLELKSEKWDKRKERKQQHRLKTYKPNFTFTPREVITERKQQRIRQKLVCHGKSTVGVIGFHPIPPRFPIPQIVYPKSYSKQLPYKKGTHHSSLRQCKKKKRHGIRKQLKWKFNGKLNRELQTYNVYKKPSPNIKPPKPLKPPSPEKCKRKPQAYVENTALENFIMRKTKRRRIFESALQTPNNYGIITFIRTALILQFVLNDKNKKPSGQTQIFMLFGGKCVAVINISKSSTVANLKEKVKKLEGAEFGDEINLFFNGIHLLNEKKLCDYGIHSSGVIHIHVPQKGGGIEQLKQHSSSNSSNHKNSSPSQYGNLNLHQSHKCSIDPSYVQSSSKSLDTQKKFAVFSLKGSSQSSNNKEMPKLQSLNHSSKISLVSKLSSIHDADIQKPKTRWKRDENSKKTSSTLSIHIAKYESFIESGDTVVSNKNMNLEKKSLMVKKVLPPIIQDSFEIPRQQQDHYKCEPEIMQFKASQKLFSPSSSSTKTQDEYKRLISNADALFQARRYVEAAAAYSDILNFTPCSSYQSAIIYANRSATYLNLLYLKNSLRKAKKDAEKAIKLNSQWWAGYYRLGCVQLELEKFDDAKKYLLEALKNSPTSLPVKYALNIAENGLIENLKHYQQRRKFQELFHNVKYQMNYRNRSPSLTSNSSSVEEHELNSTVLSSKDESFEAKRSRDNDEEFVNPHEGMYEPDVSLISDENVSHVESTNDYITLDSSSDNVEDNESESMKFLVHKPLTSKELLLIALGIDKSYDEHMINFPPLDVPYLKGKYLYIVSAEKVKHMGDNVSKDKCSPWNSKDVRSKQYFIDFEVRDAKVTKYSRTTATRDLFKDYCFEYQTSHHTFPANKKIIAVCQPHDKKPVDNSRICFYYEISENSEELKLLTEKVINPRIGPSDSGNLKKLLKHNTPSAALHIHQQNASLMGTASVVTQSQVNDLARHMTDRSPPTNKGRKKATDFDEILKLVNDKRYAVELVISGEDIKIFCGIQAAFSMMEASMITVAAANELSKEIEKALKLPADLRFTKLKEIISSQQYQNTMLTSCCYADTTFNVSELYLTILLFSSPHLTRKDGTPVCIIGAVMLSSKKDAASYEWMGDMINKHIPSNGKIAKCLATDSDLALDGLLKAKIFGSGCIRLHCGEHLVVNAESYIDDKSTQTKILNDLFGYVNNGIRLKGLFDELSFPDFQQKLNYLVTLDYWKVNTRLIEWLHQPARRERMFKRVGVVSRIKAGWGFQLAKTNIIENQNMILKSDIHDNTPVQLLIRKLEKLVNGQIVAAAMAFVQMEPVQLRNLKNFVGTEAWKRLSIEKRKQLLKTIGIEHTDSIEGFHIVPTTFPPELAPNLSPEQRSLLFEKAKILEVFQSSSKGSYVVNDNKPAKVIVADKNVACNCKYEERRANICEHLLAVNFQYPDEKIIEKILMKKESQTMSQRHNAAITTTSGTKPGTSRRRAPPSTRNAKRARITEIIDLEPVALNTSAETSNANGTVPIPLVAPITNYNRSRQFESRPLAVAQRQNTFHLPTSQALRAYKIAYNLNLDELWWNSNAFYLKAGTNVRDAYKRYCAHCNMSITKKEHPVIFTHLERYQFTVKTTNELKIGYGERIICPKFCCFGVRYPYVSPDCIISEVDDLLTDTVMQQIFPS